MPRAASSETSGIEPPVRTSSGRTPSTSSNASSPSSIARRIGRDEPGGARRPQLHLDVGSGGCRLPEQPLEDRGDHGRVLPGGQPDGDVRLRLDRDHGLLQGRRAAVDAVHVDRRLGPGAQVELLRAPRRPPGGSRPPRSPPRPAAGASSPRAPLGDGGTIPTRSASGTRPSRGITPDSVWSMACIAFSEAPPKIPEWRSRFAGADGDVEVADAAHRDVERRDVALDHAAVEHDRRVGATLVLLEPVDDRVPADLLLAVAREADVDREARLRRRAARPP